MTIPISKGTGHCRWTVRIPPREQGCCGERDGALKKAEAENNHRVFLGWGWRAGEGKKVKKKKKDMNYISQTHALIVQSLLSRTVLGTVGNAEKQDTDPVREKVNNVLRFQGRT